MAAEAWRPEMSWQQTLKLSEEVFVVVWVECRRKAKRMTPIIEDVTFEYEINPRLSHHSWGGSWKICILWA